MRSTGSSPLRSEDPALLTGQARFVADLSGGPLDNAAHVAFVRSPYASASITGIDSAEALDAPGVLAVVDGRDIPHLRLGAYSYTSDPSAAQPILPTSEVRFAGQPVVAVVAESAAEAADAAEFVVVDFETTTATFDLDEGLAQTVLEDTRLPAEHDEARFESCDIVVTQRVTNPRQSPAPIEPIGMACVWSDDGDLHVWAATQRPHGFRDQLAITYELERERIHVTAPAVGGGFGGKVSRTAEEHLLPELARITGRPVRWNETRWEYFASATQGRGERLDITLAGDGDGTFRSIRVDLVKDAGAYPSVGVRLAGSYGLASATSVYAIPYAEFDSVAVRTNLPPTSAFRGAGRAAVIAGIERVVDLFAAEIHLDPAELRRRNLVRPDTMPYTTATGAVLDEANYPAALEQALECAGYDALREEQAERRGVGSTRELGIGIGCYNHMTTGGGGEEASVTIESDGSATVITGSTSQGHGHATTWAQIASDVLGLPVASIRVVEGSTDSISTGVGAVGSRSLQTAGVAVHRTSNEILARARLLAADHLEAAETDIVVGRGAEPGLHVVGTPARSVSWAQLATLGVGGERELSCGEFYDTEGRNTFPSGCHVGVVEVDIEIGSVRVLRLVAVDDAGPRVNPMIVEGQLHGGIASGIAQVLGEVMVYDELGTPLTSSFADYPIGACDQFPMFEVVADAVTVRSSFNELGVKGVGESGTIGATPAIHNAILDALRPHGVRHIDIPCTPVRVWEALTAAQGLG